MEWNFAMTYVVLCLVWTYIVCANTYLEYWLIKLSDNKLSNNKLSSNKLSDNNLASELVENMTFLNQSQARKL